MDGRQCAKCGLEKPAAEFHRRSDGAKLRSHCKACTARYAAAVSRTEHGRQVRKRAVTKYLATEHGQAKVKAYRESPRGREILKTSARKFQKSEHGRLLHRAQVRAYRQTPNGKLIAKRTVERYKARHPERARAVYLLNIAVQGGKLSRGPCEQCGARAKIHGHHHDYTKPYDVTWLCDRCHRLHHGQEVA